VTRARRPAARPAPPAARRPVVGRPRPRRRRRGGGHRPIRGGGRRGADGERGRRPIARAADRERPWVVHGLDVVVADVLGPLTAVPVPQLVPPVRVCGPLRVGQLLHVVLASPGLPSDSVTGDAATLRSR